MRTNLTVILSFLEKCWQKLELSPSKGCPVTYSQASMVLFFMHMMLKRIHTFKGMEKYASHYYASYGWQQHPSRTTIKRRFLALPSVLHLLLPQIANECALVNHSVFGFSWAFVDKSIFRAMGGIWHKIHIKSGIIPHSSIDTEASWGYSPYHKWRFGYGLHLIVNQYRFPIVALVTTAKIKDYTVVEKLLTPILTKIGVLVGDAGYFALRYLKRITNLGVFLYTHKSFLDTKTAFKKYYNQLVQTPQAQSLYRKRKPSVEPVFSIIKELFQLKANSPLPFKGLPKVEAFLLTTVVTVQLMMYLNFTLNKDLAHTDTIINQL